MNTKAGFLSLLRPYRKQALLALVAIFITNLLSLAFPWAIKLIIDEVLVKKSLVLLNSLALVLVVVFILKSYFGFVREYLVALIGESVVRDLRQRIHWHLVRLSVRYVENTPKGVILSGIIGDVESVRKFLFGGALDFIYACFNLLFVLAILLFLDWRLTLVSLIYLPVFGLTFFKLTPRLKEQHTLVREKYAQLTSRLNEVFNGIRIVAGFTKEQDEAAEFGARQKEIFTAAMGSHTLGVLLWMGSELISSLGLVTLIWLGTKAVFTGRISMGTLMAFYSYLGMLFYPVVKMVIVNNYYQEAAVAMQRISRILDEEPRVKEKEKPLALKRIKGDVLFSGVSFGYEQQKEVLSGINLQVQAAEVVALVGKSGAGKTSLINLLLRFYDPGRGEIYIDGHNLKELELKAYRSQVAMVLQDDYLFSGTVKENILYSKPAASEAEMVKAAQLAEAHQFISELPRGYESEIGERGVRLSFGQRQRISIARAILRDPAILILDEATSNVDSATERLIIEQAFQNLMRGCTTFVIAHRLSAVAYADKIVFIEGGRIVEAGTHYQLLNKQGHYWRMWQENYAADKKKDKTVNIEPFLP